MSSAKGNTLFEDFEVEGYGIVALTIGAPGERQLKEAEQIILEATQSKNLLVNNFYLAMAMPINHAWPWPWGTSNLSLSCLIKKHRKWIPGP